MESPRAAKPSPDRPGFLTLFVSDRSRHEEPSVPISFGVPFAASEDVQDVSAYAIFDGDDVRPTVLDVLSRWDTPSRPVRWALVRTALDLRAGSSPKLALGKPEGPASAPTHTVRVEETADAYRVHTGSMSLELSKKEGTLIRRVQLAERVLVDAGSHAEAGVTLALTNGEIYRSRRHRAPKLTLEQHSPLHARFHMAFDLVSDRGVTLRPKSVRVVCRLEVFAGRSEIKLRVQLENDRPMHDRPGHFDPSSIFTFDRLSLGFPLVEKFERIRTHEFDQAKERLRVLQRHELRNPTNESENFRYELLDGDRVLERGDRHPGHLAVAGRDYSIHAAVRWFWQNYEKALSVEPGLLRVELWPAEGSYPRGEKGYRLAGGRRKAHDVYLSFSAEAGADPALVTARFLDPVVVRADPSHYANTYAFGPTDDGRPPFSADDPRAWRAYQRYNETLRYFVGASRQPAHPRERIHSIIEAKEIRGVVGGDYDLADWYGWPHFGDLAWDTGQYASNHYDMAAFMAIHFLRLGDREFWDFAEPHMRFSAELGQYWADDPDVAYPSISFYEKTRHGAEDGPPATYNLASHNWLKRLVLLHWLTGDPFAKEAAEKNAEGLVRYFYETWMRIDQPEKIQFPGGWSVLSEPRFVTWTLENFLDLYALSGDPIWMKRSEDLVRAVLHIRQKTGHINGGFEPNGGGALMTHYAVEPLVRFHLESRNEPLQRELLKVLEEVLLDTYGAKGIRGAKGREVAFATGSGSDYRPACTHLSWDNGQGRACFGVFNGFVASLYGYVGDRLLGSAESSDQQRGRRYLAHARELWTDGWLYPSYQSPGSDPESRIPRDENGFDYWYWVNGFPNAAEKVNARLARMGLPYLYVLHRRAVADP